MITGYTVRVVAHGSGTVMKRVKRITLREAKKEAHRLLLSWRDGGVKIEILRHETKVVS